MSAQLFEQLAAVVIPASSTLTLIYKCPADRKADVNVTLANSADTATDIKFVHIKNDLIANVSAEDFLIGGAGAGLPTSTFSHNMAPVEINGLAMSAGDELGAFSTASALAAQVHGIEEDV